LSMANVANRTRTKAALHQELHQEQRRPYDTKNCLELKLQGWTYLEIGKYYGVTKEAIFQRLKAFRDLIDQDGLAAVDRNRVELLKAAEWKMLTQAVKKDKLEKASVNNLAYAFTQLHQARRLEAGQSTGNLSLHSIIERIEREERRAPFPTAIEAGEESGENGR